MTAVVGHEPNRSYMDGDGAFHLNGAAFFNDAEEDISQELEALDGVATALSALDNLDATELGYLDGVTAGTATASKAVVVDANKDVGTLRNVTATSFLGSLTGNVTYTTAARTATADGLTTGTIADAGLLQFVTVTSASADNIVVLPTPTPGTIVILGVAATGYELRTSAPATVAINGGTGSGAESAIGANTLVVAICESATSWKALQLGSDGTLAKVEVAA